MLKRQLMVARATFLTVTRLGPPAAGPVRRGRAVLQAAAGQDAELDLRHIEPTAVLGGVVNTSRCNAPGLGRGKVSYSDAVRWGSGCPGPDAPPRPPGRPRPPASASGGRSPAWCAARDRHLPPASWTWAHRPGQVAGALSPPVLVVAAPVSPAGPAAGAGCQPATGWRLVKADHRPLGVIGFGVQVQHVLHVGHELGAHPWNAPLLLLPRLEGVFLRCSRTVSWDKRAPIPTPPPCPPAGAGSSGHVLPAVGAGQRDEVGFAPVVQLPVPMGLGSVVKHPCQPRFGGAAWSEIRCPRPHPGLGPPGERSIPRPS